MGVESTLQILLKLGLIEKVYDDGKGKIKYRITDLGLQVGQEMGIAGEMIALIRGGENGSQSSNG